MGIKVDHICGKTFHRRKGAVENAFTYGIDYMLIDLADAPTPSPLFSRNKFNLNSIHDIDHGGVRGEGKGIAWARQVLALNGLEQLSGCTIYLLAQPRLLGHAFNPVCFWMVVDGSNELRAVIAEVNNTFGERHSYLCHHSNLRPITQNDRLFAQKIFHVSPFQPVQGQYSFRFHFAAHKIGVWIDYETEDEGVYATFTGSRSPVTTASILKSSVRRPFGSLRILGLIHWQALKLKLKGAVFRSKPEEPQKEVSTCAPS